MNQGDQIQTTGGDQSSIDLTPSWESTARIYCLTLRNGSPSGQQMAEEEIIEMGRMLDRIKKESQTVPVARDYNGAQEGDVDPEDTSIDEQVANNQPHREGDE